MVDGRLAAVSRHHDLRAQARRLAVLGQVIGDVVQRPAEARKLRVHAVGGEDAGVDRRQDRDRARDRARRSAAAGPSASCALHSPPRARDPASVDLARTGGSPSSTPRGTCERRRRRPARVPAVSTSDDLTRHPAGSERPRARGRRKVERTNHAPHASAAHAVRVEQFASARGGVPRSPSAVRSRCFLASLLLVAGCGEGPPRCAHPGPPGRGALPPAWPMPMREAEGAVAPPPARGGHASRRRSAAPRRSRCRCRAPGRAPLRTEPPRPRLRVPGGSRRRPRPRRRAHPPVRRLAHRQRPRRRRPSAARCRRASAREGAASCPSASPGRATGRTASAAE